MSKSTQKPLRFLPVAGLSIRGDFDGGALSSDFGPLILRGVDALISSSINEQSSPGRPPRAGSAACMRRNRRSGSKGVPVGLLSFPYESHILYYLKQAHGITVQEGVVTLIWPA